MPTAAHRPGGGTWISARGQTGRRPSSGSRSEGPVRKTGIPNRDTEVTALEEQLKASHDEKLALVAAMEAEEKEMLAALTRLNDERQASAVQLRDALERIRSLEAHNQVLASRQLEEQKKAEAQAAAEGKARAFARDMQERGRQAEAQAAVLRSTIERQQQELYGRNKHIQMLEEQQDEAESRLQDYTFQLQECKFSRAKDLAAQEQQHQTEIQRLNAQLRAFDNALQESREASEIALNARSQEVQMEIQLRKEAEARDEASRALVRELRHKLEMCESQTSVLRGEHHDMSQALNESQRRLSQALEEEEGWKRRMRDLTEEAREREKILKQSRNEVVALEGVVRQAYKIISIQRSAREGETQAEGRPLNSGAADSDHLELVSNRLFDSIKCASHRGQRIDEGIEGAESGPSLIPTPLTPK